MKWNKIKKNKKKIILNEASLELKFNRIIKWIVNIIGWKV